MACVDYLRFLPSLCGARTAPRSPFFLSDVLTVLQEGGVEARLVRCDMLQGSFDLYITSVDLHVHVTPSPQRSDHEEGQAWFFVRAGGDDEFVRANLLSVVRGAPIIPSEERDALSRFLASNWTVAWPRPGGANVSILRRERGKDGGAEIRVPRLPSFRVDPKRTADYAYLDAVACVQAILFASSHTLFKRRFPPLSRP